MKCIKVIASCMLGFLLPFAMHAQVSQVYINEVVASNVNVMHDEFFEYTDWIELYNDALDEINLAGYSITNRNEQEAGWVFPSVTVPAKGYFYVFASGRDIKNTPVIWNTTIDKGDSIKYLIADSNTPDSWFDPGYDDNQWSVEKSGFGYGDNDDATQLPNGTVSVFLRATFQVNDMQNVATAMFHIDYDDAFVAYLNGVEIARSNIGTQGAPVAYNQLALTDGHEALLYQNQMPEGFEIANIGNLLVNGTNVLAVQVHNASTGSSDLTAIPFLSLGYHALANQPRVSNTLNLVNSNLHTNFKLDNNGETLKLYKPSGNLIDTLAYKTLMADVAFGRSATNLSKTGYIAVPTPGFANNVLVDTCASVVSFSMVAGFYNSTQTLELSTTDTTDIIYYTTNGNYPTDGAKNYTQPILLDSTTVVRAFAANAIKLSGKVTTQTYFINEEVHLPVLSLVTNAEHFFSDESGIYVTGTNGIQGQCDGLPRNLNQEWERPVNIEFFETNGTEQMNQMAGVKIFGGCSRTRYPQKSLAIYARSDYGKGAFDYKFFANKNIDKFESLLLRSAADDQVYTMLRDPIATAVMVEYMDVDYQAYQPVVVFFNGEYWGIHNLQEKINERYLESNFNVDADKANILDKDGSVVSGDNTRYKAMIDFATKNNLSDQSKYTYVESQMNVNQYIDYMIANIYLAEGDWPGNNIKFWSADESAYTRWRWLQYDRDQTFKEVKVDAMAKATQANCNCGWPNPPWSTQLLRSLLKNEGFKNKFIQLFAFHMAATFDASRLIGFIDSYAAGIADEIPRHITKWGGKKVEDSSEGWQEPTFSSVEQWESNVQLLRDFANERPDYASEHIKNYFGLSGMANLTVSKNMNTGGYVKLYHKILPDDRYSENFYKGIPVELTAVAAVGYEFDYWLITDNSGSKQEGANTTNVTINGATTVEAYFKTAGEIEGPLVVINEINYNPDSTQNTGDWVELYNRHTSEIDLNGWLLKDSEDENTFIFPKGTVIKGNQYYVACQKIGDFNALFPYVLNATGDLGFKLSNSGEVIRLFDAGGVLIDSVHYFDSKPWPKNADGDGFTLELMATDLENDWAESWMASGNEGGTPGWKNGTEWVSVNEPETNGNKSISNLIVYPNPVRTHAYIGFTLIKSGAVTLSITDYLGREVEQFNWEQLGAGNYSTLFNKGNLLPGIYICILQIDGKPDETIKIVVL